MPSQRPPHRGPRPPRGPSDHRRACSFTGAARKAACVLILIQLFSASTLPYTSHTISPSHHITSTFTKRNLYSTRGHSDPLAIQAHSVFPIPFSVVHHIACELMAYCSLSHLCSFSLQLMPCPPRGMNLSSTSLSICAPSTSLVQKLPKAFPDPLAHN